MAARAPRATTLAHLRSTRRGRSGRGRGTVPRTWPARPRRITKSAVRLARAPSSPCPHCGRTSKTVQGVCADCWGPKEAGARQFWIRKEGPRDSLLADLEELLGFDPFHPAVLS